MATDCWSFKRCGREPGGATVHELGVCPASTLVAADGIHGGTNGGRACWAIVGTFCDGNVQNSLAAKLHHCVGCEFRTVVQLSEGSDLFEPHEIRERIERAKSA